MKKISSIFLRVSITGVLLIFLFSKTDFRALFAVLARCDYFLMLEALGVFLFLNLLGLWRWHILLKGLALHVGFGRLCSSYLSSQFFNLVLPSTVGGDALRTLDIAQHTGRHSSGILATVILDRLAGFFGLMTVLIAALIFGFRLFKDESILLATAILFVLMAFLTGIMFSHRFFHQVMGVMPFKRIKEYLIKLHGSCAGYKKQRGVLLSAWLISCVIQGGVCVVYYFMASSIGMHLPLIYYWVFVPMITTFSVIPLSIGGLGLRDTACVAVFGKVGVAAESALTLSLMNFGFMLFLGLLGGVVYVFALHRRRV